MSTPKMVAPRRALPGVCRTYFFKALLLAVGLWLTNHQVVERVGFFIRTDRYAALVVFAIIWLSALAAIFYLSLAPPSWTRTGWIVGVALSTFVGDLYFRITDDRLTLGAVEAIAPPLRAYLGSGELWRVVSFYSGQGLTSLLGAALLSAGLLWKAPGFHRLESRALRGSPWIAWLLVICIVVYVADAPGFETRGLPGQFLSAGVVAVYLAAPAMSVEREEVHLSQVGPAAARHIVLIVDESVRGDFVDLSGSLETTPYLTSIAPQVADFGLAISGHNCSNGSNAILRLGANPESFGSARDRLMAHPSIWKYARRAGFETTYIDTQRVVAAGQNFLTRPEAALIDEVVEIIEEDVPFSDVDDAAGRALAEILRSAQPQFVFVSKTGVHFHYEEHYPESEAFFEPRMAANASIGDRELLLNSYKNAIRWRVDHFFRLLLPRVDLSQTVVLYTSDHGQNLLDDGRDGTHCRGQNANLYEAIVPLLIFSEAEDLAERFREAARLNRDRASLFQVFPTLLTLMGYSEAEVGETYYDSLFSYQTSPLGFTSGPVAGRFRGAPRWHPADGIREISRPPGHASAGRPRSGSP